LKKITRENPKTLPKLPSLSRKPTKPSPKNPQKQPKATYPKYKLHYFAIRFRAEPIRLMFAYKKVPFDDFRIDQKDWPTLKSSEFVGFKVFSNVLKGKISAFKWY
jgi:hypothetical protein